MIVKLIYLFVVLIKFFSMWYNLFVIVLFFEFLWLYIGYISLFKCYIGV